MKIGIKITETLSLELSKKEARDLLKGLDTINDTIIKNVIDYDVTNIINILYVEIEECLDELTEDK